MSEKLAQNLAEIMTLLDELPRSEQAQAMALLNTRYPGVGLLIQSDSDRVLAERRERDRARKSFRGNSADSTENGASPTPSSSSTSSSSSSTRQLDLEKARSLLDAHDFEFLSECPEPFRSAWLGSPQWWVSMRDSFPKLRLQLEANKCMGWVQSNFSEAQAMRQNLRSRFRNWLGKAERIRADEEMRKAFRR